MSSFTLEHLLEAKRKIDALPPLPFFASSKDFPISHAVQFQWDGRDYVAAHPDFWAQLPASDRGLANSLFAIEIVNIDINRVAKAEFFAAFVAALQPTSAG